MVFRWSSTRLLQEPRGSLQSWVLRSTTSLLSSDRTDPTPSITYHLTVLDSPPASPSDLCLNRQARPAYRCNMAASKPYCFRLATRCYGAHYPDTGHFYKAWDRMALIHCVDDFSWAG